MAEGAPLLREYTVCSRIEGSNPSLTAISLLVVITILSFYFPSLKLLLVIHARCRFFRLLPVMIMDSSTPHPENDSRQPDVSHAHEKFDVSQYLYSIIMLPPFIRE